jgi:hypothetical protein
MDFEKLTPADCELLALARVGRPVRDRESALANLRWFDYRHLHPVQLTYLWAQTYEECAQRFVAQTKDRDAAPDIRAFNALDIFMSPEVTACWMARQGMDMVGCRYEFGIMYALRRFSDRGWRMFPRPNQLYGTEFLLDLKDAWKIECDASLQLPKHARFKRTNYRGDVDQDAFHDWLMGEVKRRKFPEKVLARLISEDLADATVSARHFAKVPVAA